MPRAASRATPTILNEVGREQARALRERLAHLRPARIYASSSRRTRETAELAFGHLDLDLIVSDQLREIGLGDWEGQLYQDLEHRHPEAVRLFRQEPHNFRYPGAETFAELQARGLAALADIVAREEPGSDILVVSHGAMIRALLSHYLERPLSRLWSRRGCTTAPTASSNSPPRQPAGAALCRSPRRFLKCIAQSFRGLPGRR